MYNAASSLDPTYRRKHKRNGNRKRNGYELTSQRDMLPIALGAGLASIVVYCLLYYYAPSIFAFPMKVINDYTDEVPVKFERVVVKDVVEEEPTEPEPPIETPEEPVEIENIPQEEIEIDILDFEVEELIMAPGETELSVPEPAPTPEEPSAVAEMKPTELDAGSLAAPSMPMEAMSAPEPTPINHNEVIIKATAQLEAVDEAGKLVESDLKTDSKAGQGDGLPSDNRSLADLIGQSNLGASSGVARLGSDVLFGFNECKLKNSARITMLQLAALIQKNPNTRFIIEGHTDSIGGNSYNALLSMQRAAAVREWLNNNMVPTNNVYIRPCAENTPLAPTTGNKDAQKLNRRVEIHMRKPTEELPPGCENNSYKVDLTRKLSVQLAAGVPIPKTYPSASIKNGAAAPKPATPANDRNRRNNNRGRNKK
ncbi:MAG: OmpA family protein [Akkermansia sp.]|nr:OmpA family protein [Akkermansia sp.]